MKRLTLIVLLFSGIALLAYSNGQKESAADSEKAGPEEIIYYMWDDPTYKDIVGAFNDQSEAVSVEMKVVPAGDYEAKLATLLAGGAEMDAYMQKRQVDMFSQYANGYIAELDGLIEEHGFDLEGVSAYESAIQIDGTTVAIPFRGAGYYIYYNEKLFEEAGVPTPDTYVENGDWTWAKYEEVARNLASGDDERHGALWYTWGICQAPLAFQEGVQFITADGQIDVDESVWESFKLRKSLEQDNVMPALVDLKVTKTHYSQKFFEGNQAMLTIGEWFPGYMIKAREDGLMKGFGWEDWAITRMPHDGATYNKYGNPTFSHIHADSDKKDAAFQFIGWMGGAEGATVVAKNGFLPARVTPAVKEALSSAVPDQQSVDYLTESVPVEPVFYNKYGTRIDQYLGKFIETYTTTDMSDAEMKQEFREGLEQILNTTN